MLDFASSRFISPPHPPSSHLTLVESTPPALKLATKLDALAISRVYKARLSRLVRPTDGQLRNLIRDMGIALAVDVAGMKAIEVARVHEIPRSRVTAILSQIREEAGISSKPRIGVEQRP